MKRKVNKIIVAFALGSALVSSSAFAALLPTDEQFAAGGFRSVGEYGWSVTDSLSPDTVFGTFTLTLQDALQPTINDFGLYSVNESGSVATWQVFENSDVPGGDGVLNNSTDRTIYFKKDAVGDWMISDSATTGFTSFGRTFGFYSSVYDKNNTVLNRWYSEDARNSDGLEHMKVMAQEPNITSIFIVNTVDGASSPYINMRVNTDDLRSPASEVPEPVTMVLFGLGLLGIASFTRHRKK